MDLEIDSVPGTCSCVGKSDFFCLRDRVPENGYKSCQTLSHADRRFTPAEDSFYAPIGLHYNTPAANSLKVVNINDLSNVQQARIMDASYTRAVGIGYLMRLQPLGG